MNLGRHLHMLLGPTFGIVLGSPGTSVWMDQNGVAPICIVLLLLIVGVRTVF